MGDNEEQLEAADEKRLLKWADRAMWEAVPTNTTGGNVKPTVKLLSMTPDPLGVIAATAMMYEGKPVDEPLKTHGRSINNGIQLVTDDDRLYYLEQFKRTRLRAPFEFVNLHFLIEGVTRAFTHQLVRQRTAAYVQESLRFAVKTNAALEVALPPSLVGTEPYDPRVDYEMENKSDQHRAIWDQAVMSIADAYNTLVNMGMPAEEARGLLPTNITTRVHYKTDLRNLLEHAGNRLCTQAQFEWREVFVGIVKAIRESGVYKASELADLFRPICWATGKCEFMSDMDRFCSIRDRVEEFHSEGVPSSMWDAGQGAAVESSKGYIMHTIAPEEWLADPTAARRSQ